MDRYYPALVVRFVDPGCTLELQVDQPDRCVRVTTTECGVVDRLAFRRAVIEALDRRMDIMGI